MLRRCSRRSHRSLKRYPGGLFRREPPEPGEQLLCEPQISFTKQCENHRFTAAGREMLATVVTVPEIDGTFLELETRVDAEDDLDKALADLRAMLAVLGVSSDQLTTELYTDAVAASRHTS